MISKSEAFLIGFQFATRIVTCYDARDIGRVLMCNDFPPEIQALSNQMHWTASKDAGMVQAMKLITETLDREVPEPPDA
jgi:hypothetical protein